MVTDFNLLLERYGYKMLFMVFGVILLVILGALALYIYAVFKLYGILAGGVLLVAILVYALTRGRKVLDTEAQASVKYLHGNGRQR